MVLCDGVFVAINFKTMHNKTITRFGFCDIWNNQGPGTCYQPRPSAQLKTLTCTSTLIIPDITKTSSSNIVHKNNKGENPNWPETKQLAMTEELN